MNKSWWESPVCWLCDYGLFVMVFFMILLFGLYRFQYGMPVTAPSIEPIPSSTSVVVVTTNTPFPTEPIPGPSVTFTPVNDKPEFILVFVPVDWQSDQSAFQEAAQRQADIFVSESKIEDYFTVNIVILEDGVQNVSLRSDELVYDILEFGLQKQPGDRYIGLTDGDLYLDGDSDIVGWTSGGQAMVAESQDFFVVAHELGHTFGLCDEYSYTDWSLQNSEYGEGCPNPYPKECPRVESNVPVCDGAPAKDGSNSIMGPAGLLGEYSFNNACFEHLQKVFETLSDGDIP